MTLLVPVLLVVAALAVAVRIVQSRNAFGVVLIGVVVLGAMGGTAWQFPGVLPAIGEAHAASADVADDESQDVAADDTTVTAASSEEDEIAPAEEDTDESSVEIETSPGGVLIPPRPDWVESEDVLTGDAQLMVVSSGPEERERDCRRSLDEELVKAVDAYIDQYLGKVYGDNFKASTFVSYDLDEYIKPNLCKATHEEVIRVSFGPMHQMHALLEFSPEFRTELDGRCDEIDEHWQQIAAVGRLTGTALAFGFILALLGVVFGYFRLDTATRGYYTGRLQLASAGVILTLIVAGVLLARHIL